MNPLRSKLIRLAHANPDLRPTILPLLVEGARTAGFDDLMARAVANGWEELKGAAYEKAESVIHADVDVAKKFGRKTVFARFHGMVTLYVVRDDGRVVQDEFANLPSDNAIKEFVRVSLEEPRDKTASFSLVKETISIPTMGGKVVEVAALVHGPWSIYKNLKGAGYAVTFTPTGQAVSQKNPTLMDAKAFLEALLDRAPDLAHANDIGDVMRHKDIIVELIKNPPAVSGTALKGPVEKVSEKREKLIADIKAAGLAPMGTRSGKAGEFFAARGLKSAPTRAISVGTRDVLLNEFDMYDEKWKMVKAELISATTPEHLTKWVAWVNAGPARGELRSSR